MIPETSSRRRPSLRQGPCIEPISATPAEGGHAAHRFSPSTATYNAVCSQTQRHAFPYPIRPNLQLFVRGFPRADGLKRGQAGARPWMPIQIKRYFSTRRKSSKARLGPTDFPELLYIRYSK